MATDPPITEFAATEPRWQEIDDLLDEIARLSKSELSSPEFYRELLTRCVKALAAVGGAVWTRDADGTLLLESHTGPITGISFPSLSLHEPHTGLLFSVLKSGVARAVPANESAASHSQHLENPTRYLLLLCPLVVNHSAVGVIEVFQRADSTQAARDGYLRFLEALGELAADFHQQRQMRDLQGQADYWHRCEDFLETIHRSLDISATAYEIANAGRALIGCDRLSVIVHRARKCQVAAVSGLDSVDRRANTIQRLEQLANEVLQGRKPLWFSGDMQGLPAPFELLLQAYLDLSHARSLTILPLPVGQLDDDEGHDDRTAHMEAPIVGALVVEQFESSDMDEEFRRRVGLVARHSGLALRSAVTHRNLPLYFVTQALQRSAVITSARQLPKTLGVLLAIAAVIAVLVFIPADFDISGRGQLWPKIRRDVFAGSDGVVHKVLVEHSASVQSGQPVVELRKSQLDFEFSRVLGEMQTARKRQSAIQALRLKSNPTTSADANEYNKLIADEEELKEQLKSLEQQYAILTDQQRELIATSPIDGRVLTWDVKKRLEARPVDRGQSLLTIADVAGPWVLEIKVPDHRIGHVRAAQKNQETPLSVTFVLATDPDTVYHGVIADVAISTETEEAAASVLVTVEFDRNQINELRPGATVIPRIDCGTRSLGYVWFHDVWEAIQTRILF